MSVKVHVLLIGATGETGSAILDGLVEDGSFNVTLYTRDTSRSSAAVKTLVSRGFTIVSTPDETTHQDLIALLEGIDIVISAVGPTAILDQFQWISAAKEAGVKRFIPCGFITICPRGGIMRLRDEKELVHDHIFRLRLPYTIVDVGYWYILSHFRLSSGRLDHVSLFPNTEIYASGTAPNLLIDKADIGRFMVRIIKDPRTLNTRVVAYGDELSQLQIRDIMEKLSGEKLALANVSQSSVREAATSATAAVEGTSENDMPRLRALYSAQYRHSKYVRGDNTRENALYLGYLDARELYPGFTPCSFEVYLQTVLAGGGRKPYGNLKLP